MSKIFVSYRRDDSADVTERIYEHLLPPIGLFPHEVVFRDVDSIPFGVDFKKYLEDQLEQCQVCLVVIGPNWATIRDEQGNLRMHDPHDFVRIEVQTALQGGIPVIPLLVMGARMPTAAELPPDLAELVHYNGTVIQHDPDFRGSMDRLRRALTDRLDPSAAPVEVQPAPVPVQRPPQQPQFKPAALPPAEPKHPSVPTITPDQQRLLDIMFDIKRPPAERAKAGQDINQFTDPRLGVLDFNWGNEYWRKVPAGTFTYQEKQTTIDYDFWIGRYPVTYAQYKLFLDAADGFKNTVWWQGLHTDGVKQQTEGAGDQGFKFANHPAERVSWYDSIAFCRWVNVKMKAVLPQGHQLRLPLETEWEKAARGTDGREFPWGNGYQAGYANINEMYRDNVIGSNNIVGPNHLLTTTAVGLYPQGASPYGALDMCGNVWQWMINEYGSGKVNIGSNESRGVRGGSYVNSYDNTFTAFRIDTQPHSRFSFRGFRFVVVGGAPLI